MGFAILLQILPRVIQPNLTLFQKPVEFISRLKTEDTLKLRRRQLAFAIRLERDGLERGSREVRTRSSQGGREFVRKIEADLHGVSIATWPTGPILDVSLTAAQSQRTRCGSQISGFGRG